jgi:organic hydroperoxide reductase OsmC/OhrA
MNEKIHAHIKRRSGYKFEISFDEWDKGTVEMDEPVPLGEGSGPNASMMLSSAVGHCLSASLLFCLGKSRVDAEDLEAEVETSLMRNDRGRWRIEGIKVIMKPSVKDSDREKLARCLTMFEDFCIVTASVREGIKVEVELREQNA